VCFRQVVEVERIRRFAVKRLMGPSGVVEVGFRVSQAVDRDSRRISPCRTIGRRWVRHWSGSWNLPVALSTFVGIRRYLWRAA
jgi:hypothetical protein